MTKEAAMAPNRDSTTTGTSKNRRPRSSSRVDGFNNKLYLEFGGKLL